MHRMRRPPGQSKILAMVQGFSELSGSESSRDVLA